MKKISMTAGLVLMMIGFAQMSFPAELTEREQKIRDEYVELLGRFNNEEISPEQLEAEGMDLCEEYNITIDGLNEIYWKQDGLTRLTAREQKIYDEFRNGRVPIREKYEKIKDQISREVTAEYGIPEDDLSAIMAHYYYVKYILMENGPQEDMERYEKTREIAEDYGARIDEIERQEGDATAEMVRGIAESNRIAVEEVDDILYRGGLGLTYLAEARGEIPEMDGSSIEKAVLIKYTGDYSASVGQEYEYIASLFGREGADYTVLMQSTMSQDGKAYDVIEIEMTGSGEKKAVFFDITELMAQWE